MQTFREHVEALVGESISDLELLNDLLTYSSHKLINIIPASKVGKWSYPYNATNGMTVADHRVVELIIDNYRARPVQYAQYMAAQRTNSLFRSVTTDPVYTMYDGKLYFYPTTFTSAKLLAIGYFPIAYTYTPDNIDTTFPREFTEALLLDTAVQYLITQMTSASATIGGLVWGTITPPVSPSAPVFTFQDVSGQDITSTTIGSFGTAPAFPTTPHNVTTGIDLSTHLSQAMTYFETDEDIELGKAKLEEIGLRLGEYNAEVEAQGKKFNELVIAYQAAIQREIEQARLTQERLTNVAKMNVDVDTINQTKELERQVAEYSASLGRFSHQVGLYQAEVAAEAERIRTLVGQGTAVMQASIAPLSELKARYGEAVKVFLEVL